MYIGQAQACMQICTWPVLTLHISACAAVAPRGCARAAQVVADVGAGGGAGRLAVHAPLLRPCQPDPPACVSDTAVRLDHHHMTHKALMTCMQRVETRSCSSLSYIITQCTLVSLQVRLPCLCPRLHPPGGY